MLEVAAERGVAHVTVADVVALAGVSRRTFYELYENIDQCLEATIELAFRRASEAVERAYLEAGDAWQERVRAALTALLCFFDREPSTGVLLLGEWQHAGPVALRRRSGALASLVKALDEGGDASRNGRGGLSPLTAEALAGATCFIVGERLRDPRRGGPLTELVASLMSFIVLPYLGPAAARRELEQPARNDRRGVRARPMPATHEQINMRLTYRTLKVLTAVGEHPRSSNRFISDAAGIVDQGQASKLLARLKRSGLIENVNAKAAKKGAPNAWRLTVAGEQLHSGLPPMR